MVQSSISSLPTLRPDRLRWSTSACTAPAPRIGRQAIIGLPQDISKKRAEEQIARYVKQLEGAFMRTVEVATTLSEMRDPYTAALKKGANPPPHPPKTANEARSRS
ncbi:MAG: hypothetical protein M5R42_05170 [Rhodocyclaceae bacterium]|nr:hypothetical protein [Rhodocyclaceae bacterium]